MLKPYPNTFSFAPGIAAKVGVSIEQLCAHAGVPVSNAWHTDEFFRIWLAAEAQISDRAAGLRFGAEGLARGYGVAAIVALHAPDLGQALVALSRYKRLTCPELVEVEVAHGEAAVRYRWLQATGPVPRLLVDTTMASLRELVRRGTAGQIAPIRLELARPVMDGEMLHQHFGCPIVFEAAHDQMVFAQAALATPFVTADGGAFAHVLQGLESRLDSGEGYAALLGQIRVAIARQLSEGRPSTVAAIARRLGLSSRTLQRRLRDSATSFQQQLDAVRRITACRLLANTPFDPIAVALLLGYTEPNSFARVFRHWEHTTPQRWREQHAAQRLAPPAPSGQHHE
ncbi:AraC family transcriptional regulator [Amantichitinum ursilacus]|uniref:HTH-type transcriptional regulator VirS n=1 Tax=Amantichitinum ursilacus TaxID=857265 RepID=A0A0N0GQ76_9NEIS|nr:AraC family transcriptional regulator [Amantichitinum ursilacus]KPC54433.1 HTH-type transcriptional regulator VirS [Amantichitinum ursilacus]